MPYQLNIYVPKEKKAMIERVRYLAELQGKPLYHLVLEALEEYLEQDQPRRAQFRTFHLGGSVPDKKELYQERLEHKRTGS
jgi:hypothetical protein